MHWPDLEPATLPNAIPIRRRSKLTPEETTREHLLAGGEGLPVVVTDAQAPWKARRLWSFEYFAQRYGDEELIVNDRAPLRPGDDPPMQSLKMGMRDYVSYVTQPGHKLAARERGQPFYGNSWCPFNSHPELASHISRPAFVQDSMPQEPESALTMSNNFTKVFLGPAGTVTRLHHDTFCTHAWLSQIRGRKQFVLYPPSQAHLLHAHATANGGADTWCAVAPRGLLSPQPCRPWRASSRLVAPHRGVWPRTRSPCLAPHPPRQV